MVELLVGLVLSHEGEMERLSLNQIIVLQFRKKMVSLGKTEEQWQLSLLFVTINDAMELINQQLH